MKSATHVLCVCGACTEIDRDLELMDCARCGSVAVDPVCIVACPSVSGHRGSGAWTCSLPFHDDARDAHVVPWEQRDALSFQEGSISGRFRSQRDWELDHGIPLGGSTGIGDD